MCVYVCVCVCVFVYVCVSTPEASGMIWTQYDWLSKFYSLYMASVVDIVSKSGLTIKACHRN